MKTKVMCPLCWHTNDPDPAASTSICDPCQQMIGRSPLRDLEGTVAHYRKLVSHPDMPLKMKEYIDFRTLDVVKKEAHIAE